MSNHIISAAELSSHQRIEGVDAFGGIRIYSEADLRALPPVGWLVDGILPERSLTLMYGKPGIGKSFVALDLALTIASGRCWRGLGTRDGQVLYVAGEGVSGLVRRIDAWRQERGIQALPRFGVIPTAIPLHYDKSVQNLLAVMNLQQASEPELVVFDTLAMNFAGGDENDAKDMGKLVEGINQVRQETGATVLLVHHTGKGNSKTPRGSSALEGAMDTIMMADANGRRVTVTCKKQKEAECFRPLALELRVSHGSLVVDDTDGSAIQVSRPLDSKAQQALRSLHARESSNGTGVSSADWRRSSGLPESTYHAKKSLLLGEGYVREIMRGSYGLTDVGREWLHGT